MQATADLSRAIADFRRLSPDDRDAIAAMLPSRLRERLLADSDPRGTQTMAAPSERPKLATFLEDRLDAPTDAEPLDGMTADARALLRHCASRLPTTGREAVHAPTLIGRITRRLFGVGHQP